MKTKPFFFILVILCALLLASRADTIQAAFFSHQGAAMTDDGDQLLFDLDAGTLTVDGQVLPLPEAGIPRVGCADPGLFTLTYWQDGQNILYPVENGQIGDAVALPQDAMLLYPALGDHVYYHTRDHRICRFNWKTGVETLLLPQAGDLLLADRWQDADYLIVSDADGAFLLSVDAQGVCSQPLLLPGGFYYALCAASWGDLLVAGESLYCYSASGDILWQLTAAYDAVDRVLPSAEGYTVLARQAGQVLRLELDRDGQILSTTLYEAEAPFRALPLVDGQVWYDPADGAPGFIPLQ